MWCPSCVQNEGRRLGAVTDEGDERYIDWADRLQEPRTPVSDRAPSQPQEIPRRPHLTVPGRWPYRDELTEHEQIVPFHAEPFEPQQKGVMPMHTLSSRYAVRTGIGTLSPTAPPEQGLAYFLAADKPHIIRLAHDSGSTEVIYHCPFCGSGQVIARSDGTVQCEFCQAAFTVQVQPEFSAFPQTIDGQPVDIPGMGGTSDNPDVPEDAGDDEEAAAGPTTPPGGTEEQPPEEGEDDGEGDEPIDSGGNPIFNKKSYRTASGATLDQLGYVRHLALGVAHNRDAVLTRIRAERSRRT